MTRPTSRRWRLVALVAGIAAAFTSRGEAHDPVAVDVEATPYGGRTSGRLPPSGICGYSSGVGTAFAGLGVRARLRVLASADDRTRGFTATAQGAVERQSNSLLAPGSDGERDVPPDQAMAGVGLGFGYDWRYVGFHLGVGARESYAYRVYPCAASRGGRPGCDAPDNYHGAVSLYPDVTLRAGPSSGVHFDVIFGSYSVATLLRPGMYTGLGYTTQGGYELVAHVGLQSTVANNYLFGASPRFDLSGALPVTDHVLLGLGVAYARGELRDDFDARASVTLRFGP
ncbi:MAG: hypothetical protein JWM10_399 [Myxococcaceae bacterium]|nr:hypothetical protein [Myxococcaceae bacterium]